MDDDDNDENDYDFEDDIEDDYYIESSPTKIEYKINPFIVLKLKGGKTYIYIKESMFMQCMRLILNIPPEKAELFDDFGSIDEVVEGYNHYLYENKIINDENLRSTNGEISPKQEFWGHCSNLQTWYEYGYDTRILKSNLAFPLLKKLTRAGDPLAKKVFKEEVAKRLESGFLTVVLFLVEEDYLDFFEESELRDSHYFNLLNIIRIENMDSYHKILNKFKVLVSLLTKKKGLLYKKNYKLQVMEQVVKFFEFNINN